MTKPEREPHRRIGGRTIVEWAIQTLERYALSAATRQDDLSSYDGVSHERLPHSELHLLDAIHFVWQNAAEEYAVLVKAWCTDGYKTCMTRSTATTTGS